MSSTGSHAAGGGTTPLQSLGDDVSSVGNRGGGRAATGSQSLGGTQDCGSSAAHSPGRASSVLQFGSERGSTIGSTSATQRSVYHGRVDLGGGPQHHRTIRVDDPAAMGDTVMDVDGAAPSGPRLYIWGTRICVTDVQRQFRRFVLEFVPDNVEDDENMMELPSHRQEIDRNSPYYMERLYEIDNSDLLHLNVNLQHVRQFSEPLYRKIIAYPADIIPYLDMTINELFTERFRRQLISSIEIRPFNADKTRSMRALDPTDVDQLITLTGMVTRTSMMVPEMRTGYFECQICNHVVESEVDRGRIEEPTVCSNCQGSYCFSLIHNRSVFIDKQIVKLQEAPDDMPSGQTAHTITVYCHGTLVESVQPGDRVFVTGIFRTHAVRLNPKQRNLQAVYRTSIDALHFRRSDKNRLHIEGDCLTEERIEQIKRLSQQPDVMDRLAHAIAPSIFEHLDVKKGILCLIFGGTRKEAENKARFRSDINVLLCGDPGTSKSQLLQYVCRITPRSQYTSGKGSSAVGLTACVVRDPDTNQIVLQTGALVLADSGVCCIDEFDKMNDSTRSVLHEVMEHQTLSIAKAGIICQLNTRTSVLAAANPVDSRWNADKTIVENIELPPTLLSRFDLIFLMLDPADEAYDRRLAQHLVSLYFRQARDAEADVLETELLRDYIAYAKENVHPQLTDQSAQYIIAKYAEMRKAGARFGQISAYARQIESLIRLSEAYAKIRLADVVTVDDVENAYELHRTALRQTSMVARQAC